MNKTTDNSISQDTQSSALEVQDSKSYLDQLEQTVAHAKEYLKTVEESAKLASEAQARADNEALRANQAKLFVEEHSNAAAKLKGLMEVDAAAIGQKRTEIDNYAREITNLRSTSESQVTAIARVFKDVEIAAKTVTETSGMATTTQANIAEIKGSIESLAQTVREETKGIKDNTDQITSAKESSLNLIAAIRQSVTTSNDLETRSKAAYATIETIEKSAKTKAEEVSDLTERSLELKNKVEDYEKNLAKLNTEFLAMKDKIDGLLPGATSTGLASAFFNQRKHFESEREKWAKMLLISLLLIFVVAIYVTGKFPPVSDSWGGIARHFLQNLPFIVPPFWLAVYAGRQHMLATRMEEEYATKTAVSISFEGYKREIASDIEASKALCNNVLATIARRPGMVYEGKQEDITAFTPAMNATKSILTAVVEAAVAKIKSG